MLEDSYTIVFYLQIKLAMLLLLSWLAIKFNFLMDFRFRKAPYSDAEIKVTLFSHNALLITNLLLVFCYILSINCYVHQCITHFLYKCFISFYF